MNQITTQYVTEGGACFEQYVITDPVAKTALTITPERGGMVTGFTLDGDEYIWTRRPNFSECNRPRFGIPVLFPNSTKSQLGIFIFQRPHFSFTRSLNRLIDSSRRFYSSNPITGNRNIIQLRQVIIYIST